MKTTARILTVLALVLALGFASIQYYSVIRGEPPDFPAQNPQVQQAQAASPQRLQLIPSGAPFGVKMFTRGVIVVGLTDVNSSGRRQNPARRAGLETGDVILKIDGEPVESNKMLGRLVSQSGGRSLSLLVCRNDNMLDLDLVPVWSEEDGTWRAGVWVRDSSAGIGTMTYIEPQTGSFAGLGHAICDVDTGELMPLESGQVVGVEITEVKRGVSGDPGELRGAFLGEIVVGELENNTPTGIYGHIKGKPEDDLPGALPIAFAKEIQPGPAEIYTTISGTAPRKFSICIEKVDMGSRSGKNMLLQVTDPQLLSLTGGILQGMSGSPIIQDGKLVGAVTHVLVNDPTRGYGIFIENMLETAE